MLFLFDCLGLISINFVEYRSAKPTFFSRSGSHECLRAAAERARVGGSQIQETPWFSFNSFCTQTQKTLQNFWLFFSIRDPHNREFQIQVYKFSVLSGRATSLSFLVVGNPPADSWCLAHPVVCLNHSAWSTATAFVAALQTDDLAARVVHNNRVWALPNKSGVKASFLFLVFIVAHPVIKVAPLEVCSPTTREFHLHTAVNNGKQSTNQTDIYISCIKVQKNTLQTETSIFRNFHRTAQFALTNSKLTNFCRIMKETLTWKTDKFATPRQCFPLINLQASDKQAMLGTICSRMIRVNVAICTKTSWKNNI